MKDGNTNKTLHTAKTNRRDEFYTLQQDVENELRHYASFFRDKVVLCNCNDTPLRAFATYFYQSFYVLGLRELICVEYHPCSHGIVYRHTRAGWTSCLQLSGTGGFETLESIALILEADVIVTNPPFSLFREFVTLLMRYDKQFLIIGHQNAITYKEIFPLIQLNRLWLGYGFKRNMAHFVSPYRDTASDADHRDGMIRVSGVLWFTNIETQKRHEMLQLTKHYNPKSYPAYDNCPGAIDVSSTKDIPCDYDGLMGMPITFIEKYNPQQFEIVRFRKGDDGKDLCVNGKCPYFRILIRLRCQQPDDS